MDTGTVVGARYRLDRRLAAGGMGVVWAAHDELLARPVALKLLHRGLADEDGVRRRFRAEARAAARLSHPGVVAVYDYGEAGDVTFLAMELVPGESLHELLRRRGPLAPNEVMGIVAQAASALADAHAHGLVHRDVKPANLLVGPNGTVKVTDFGIARAADATTATVAGSVLGTVAYMSPEQIRGERVEAPSDVYSLGVVAYEALAGTRPFPAEESIAVALSHLHDPVPALPAAVPAPVAALVVQMLRKDAAGRPTAGTVAEQAGTLGSTTGRPAAAGAPAAAAAAPAATAGFGVLEATEAFGTLHAAVPGTPPGGTAQTSAPRPSPAPLRTLGAALGTAAVAARRHHARRRPSASLVSVVVLTALALGLALAATIPGTPPVGGGLSALHHARTTAQRHPGKRSAAPATSTTSSPTTSSTTTSTASTSTASTATSTPVLDTQETGTPPGKGDAPAGGPGHGDQGQGNHHGPGNQPGQGTGPAGGGPGGGGPGGPGGPGKPNQGPPGP